MSNSEERTSTSLATLKLATQKYKEHNDRYEKTLKELDHKHTMRKEIRQARNEMRRTRP